MTTFNHSDEMTTAYDGVCDCARHNSKPIARRAPTVEDFDVWMLEVHGASLLDEIGDDYDWNAIALGFLVARGVDPKWSLTTQREVITAPLAISPRPVDDLDGETIKALDQRFTPSWVSL